MTATDHAVEQRRWALANSRDRVLLWASALVDEVDAGRPVTDPITRQRLDGLAAAVHERDRIMKQEAKS